MDEEAVVAEAVVVVEAIATTDILGACQSKIDWLITRLL